MKTNHSHGFTLVELLVALAVLAILLGVGVPSFASAIQNSCMSSNHNALASSLYLARSEAVKSSRDVTVCPRSSSQAETCGTRWENGWLVFIDRTRVNGESIATVNGTDEIINMEDEVCGDASVSGRGSADRTAAGASVRHFVRYAPDGATDWNNGSFIICDSRGAESARVINIVLTGDIRRGRASSTSGGVPLDVFGQAADCGTAGT